MGGPLKDWGATLAGRAEITGAQTTPLIISKVGFGAEIFDFAHQKAALYGVVAILLSLVAGWLPHILLRRA